MMSTCFCGISVSGTIGVNTIDWLMVAFVVSVGAVGAVAAGGDDAAMANERREGSCVKR